MGTRPRVAVTEMETKQIFEIHFRVVALRLQRVRDHVEGTFGSLLRPTPGSLGLGAGPKDRPFLRSRR